MENLNKNNLIELSENEIANIDGGLVITGSMVVGGVALVGAGYTFGSWVKNKFFK
ncbi:class IIb bacteriocin, lactobin A/cerein 7B family [Clostridium perfringens]|uniref:class IIb bacteriocin, lactobin A/cerein 7B family n=2 Tax=Clostridium perfringens TaxID=1502 RepID=UPI0024BD22EE|nr:class IIb bacteriocin, lactobin A/cerein 7B family [Clostridium perfringens]